MSVLSFGESFGCIENNRQHPYLKAIEPCAPFLSILQIILRYKVTSQLYNTLLRLPWMEFWNSLRHMSGSKAAKWIDTVADEDCGDFMRNIFRAVNEETITRQQPDDFASILCLAGAESTPVLMAGMMWWILSTPDAHMKLKQEIRATIQSPDDITVNNVAKLTYLDAVIMEGLRHNTPSSLAIPRIVPEQDAVVDGLCLPAGVGFLMAPHESIPDAHANMTCKTLCGVPHWASAN